MEVRALVHPPSPLHISFQTNDERTNAYVRRAFERESLQPDARPLLKKNEADAQRRLAWVKRQIADRMRVRRAA